MAEARTWTVKSNSFRRDFEIAGSDIGDAIERGFAQIARDARIRGRVHAVRGEFRRDILGGRGGVEITVEYTPPRSGDVRAAVVWVSADRADLPQPTSFSFKKPS